MKKAFYFLIIAVLAAASCKDEETKPVESNVGIYPKQGIEDVKLGDTASSILDKYGSGSESSFGVNGQYTHFLWYPLLGLSFNLETTDTDVFRDDMKLDNIAIESPYEKETDKGIKIGSTLTEVKAAYGEPDMQFGKFHIYDIGIAIDYDDNDTVEKITVQK